MEPGSFLMVELCDWTGPGESSDSSSSSSPSSQPLAVTLAWFRYDFLRETIDTISTKFDMRAPPKNMDTIFGSKSDGSALNVDIVITR